MNAGDNWRTLVTEDWRVHGSIYRDPRIFEQEQERIFRTGWLYLAHESELPRPGDFKTTYAGTQPIIVTRGAEDGVIRALLNRCRHRGATVCEREAGNSIVFRCPYHGWTYSSTGELRSITDEEGYQGLDHAELGLARMPRVESFAGFVFGSFSSRGPSLEEYLGNARPYLEIVAAQGPGGIALTASAQRLTYAGNWKLQVENTIDNYHFGFVHRSFVEVLTDRLGAAPPIMHNIYHSRDWRTIDLGGGHAVHEFGDPRSGENYGQIGDLPFNLIVFPSLCFVGAQLRLVLPRAVNRTEVRLYPLLRAGASAEENARILRAHESFYGPAGLGSPDDIEVAFDRVTTGLQATEDDWMLLSRGLHRETPGENGVLIGYGSDEVPQRAFYRQWVRSMGEVEA